MPLAIEPITSAPSSASQTEPRPPKRLVPAITGPAIASSSRSLPPEDWLTASRREAAMMPPNAASVEHSTNTSMRMRVTLTPERRVASALPPVAKMWRPKTVRVVTNAPIAAEADEDQPGQRDAAVGRAARARPRSCPPPRAPAGRGSRVSDGSARPARAAAHALEPARRRVGADDDHDERPADGVAVERAREAGDRRVVEVDRAGVAEHEQQRALPGEQAGERDDERRDLEASSRRSR